MKSTLGKGLEALIPQKKSKKFRFSLSRGGSQTSLNGFAPSKKESIFLIEVVKIKPNPYQPRKEFPKSELKNLADSIKEFGVLQPLIVIKIEKESAMGTRIDYQLIAGERRWRAAKMAGLDSIPVIVRSADDQKNLEVSLVENIQREDLNALERAQAFQKLIDDFNLTQREIAERMGKSRESVANTLRLLELSPDIKKYLSQSKITEGHARALIGIENKSERDTLLKKILDEQLNVRGVEELARKIKKPFRKSSKAEDFSEWEDRIEQKFGVKVKVNVKSGKVILEFQNLNDLKKLM